ncbi:hypothetical protein D3C84_871790 [compost metagenome]
MAGAEAVGQAQAHRALDQERRAELGTFGNEDPAHGLTQARVLHGTGEVGGDLGVEVRQVEAGLFGAAAFGQVRNDGDQLGVGVQRLEFVLEQVLGNDEASEAFAGFERCVGFDQGIQLGMRGMGQLVQALRTQAGAFGGGCGGHGDSLRNGRV